MISSQHLSQKIFILDKVDSTNDEAFRRAQTFDNLVRKKSNKKGGNKGEGKKNNKAKSKEANKEEVSRGKGFWVLAHQQTKGRGRNGRNWESIKGNFMASFLWSRSNHLPAHPSDLSFLASCALFHALETVLHKHQHQESHSKENQKEKFHNRKHQHQISHNKRHQSAKPHNKEHQHQKLLNKEHQNVKPQNKGEKSKKDLSKKHNKEQKILKHQASIFPKPKDTSLKLKRISLNQENTFPKPKDIPLNQKNTFPKPEDISLNQENIFPKPKDISLNQENISPKPEDISLKLKWPNDILLNGRKIAGVLIEQNHQGDFAIGFGVNLAKSPALATASPKDKDTKAICLADIDIFVTPKTFIHLLAYELDRQSSIYQNKGLSPILLDWQNHCFGLGEEITVQDKSHNKQESGIFSSLDKNGALLLAKPNGAVKTIYAGDVLF